MTTGIAVVQLSLDGNLTIRGTHTYDRANGGTLVVPTVADATARGALTPTTNELVLQLDTGTLYYYDGAAWQAIAGGGVSDHGALTGLADDDHTQYLLVDGTRALSAYLDFASIAAPSYQEGRVFYNNAEKSLAYFTDESTFEIEVGQESHFRAANNTGALIPKGSAVYVSGNATEVSVVRPEISLARADAASTSEVLGVTVADIPNGSFGWVVDQGVLRGVDTGGLSVGDILYLSETTAGALTSTLPPAGNYVKEVGVVLRASVGAGVLLVKLSDPTGEVRGTINGVTVASHASRHERGGADEIDGDHLDIDFTPSNYTPSIVPAEAANVDDLAAHLAGIDTALASAGGGPTVTTADTTSAPQTVNLPALPSAGTRRIIVDTGGNAETNPITINPNGADTIEGESSQYILIDGGSMTLISDGSQWRIENISTGAPVIPGIGGTWSSSNYYRSAAGVLTGAATGFTIEGLFGVRGDPFGEAFVSAGTSNTGFSLRVSASTILSFTAYDTGGNFIDAFRAVQGDGGVKEFGMRPLHIVGVLEDNGSFFTIYLYLNGNRLVSADNFSTPNAYAPAQGTDHFQIGYNSATTDDANESVVFGVGYDENTWTDQQVWERYEELQRAGHLTAGARDPDHRYTGRDNLDAGTTWSDVGSVGTQDLTRQGTLSTVRHVWRA